MLLIASDGIFEFITTKDCIDIASLYLQDSPEHVCNALTAEAYKHWMTNEERTDDITVICIFIEGNKKGATAEDIKHGQRRRQGRRRPRRGRAEQEDAARLVEEEGTGTGGTGDGLIARVRRAARARAGRAELRHPHPRGGAARARRGPGVVRRRREASVLAFVVRLRGYCCCRQSGSKTAKFRFKLQGGAFLSARSH